MTFRSPHASHSAAHSQSQSTSGLPHNPSRPLIFAASGPKTNFSGLDISTRETGGSNSKPQYNSNKRHSPPSANYQQPSKSKNTLKKESYPQDKAVIRTGLEPSSSDRTSSPLISGSKLSKTLPVLGFNHRKLPSFNGFSKSPEAATLPAALTVSSSTNASSKIKVNILLDQSFVMAGSELTGYIEFSCLSKDLVSASEIQLDLTGYEELSTLQDPQALNSSRKDFTATPSKPPPKFFYRTRLLIQDHDHPCPIARETGNPDSEGYWPLQQGKTTIPFVIRLASTLPNSVVTSMGKVAYNLALTVQHKSGIFKETTGFSRSLTLYEKWDPKEVRVYRKRGVRAEARRKLFMGGQSPVEMSVELVASLVVAGSIAYTRITVVNPTSKKVQGIRMKLLKTLGKVGEVSPKEVSDKVFRDADVKFPAGETRSCLLAMEIPINCLSLRHTSLVKIEYTLQVALISSLSKDLVVDLPIYISHPSSWNDPCPPLYPPRDDMPGADLDFTKDHDIPLFSSSGTDIAPTTPGSNNDHMSPNQIVFETDINPGFVTSPSAHSQRDPAFEEQLVNHSSSEQLPEPAIQLFSVDKISKAENDPYSRNHNESLSQAPSKQELKINSTSSDNVKLPFIQNDQPASFQTSEPSAIVSPPSFFRSPRPNSRQERDPGLITPEPKISTPGEFVVIGGRRYQLVSVTEEASRPHTVAELDRPYQVQHRKSSLALPGNPNLAMRHSSYTLNDHQAEEAPQNGSQNKDPSMKASPHVNHDFEPESWLPNPVPDERPSELSSLYGFMESAHDKPKGLNIDFEPRNLAAKTDVNPISAVLASNQASQRDQQYQWASENRVSPMKPAFHHANQEEIGRRSRHIPSIKKKTSLRVRARGSARRSILPNTGSNDSVSDTSSSEDTEFYETQNTDIVDKSKESESPRASNESVPEADKARNHSDENVESQLLQLQQQMAMLMQTIQTGKNGSTSTIPPNSTGSTDNIQLPEKRNATNAPPLNKEGQHSQKSSTDKPPKVIPNQTQYQMATRPKKPKKSKAKGKSESSKPPNCRVMAHQGNQSDDADWI